MPCLCKGFTLLRSIIGDSYLGAKELNSLLELTLRFIFKGLRLTPPRDSVIGIETLLDFERFCTLIDGNKRSNTYGSLGC